MVEFMMLFVVFAWIFHGNMTVFDGMVIGPFVVAASDECQRNGR